MKSLKVNADYESVLFNNKPGPAIINQSLEFLVLFLEEGPLYSEKKYDPVFLKYIEKISGHHPSIVSLGAFENWWGSLTNLQLEKKLNSKEFALQFNDDSFFFNESQLALEPSVTYLAKNPFGMSGQNFLKFKGSEREKLNSFAKKFGKVIIEPFFCRQYDFSHYIFPVEEICYQNLVDENFQYKGTILNRKNSSPEGLNFFHEVPAAEWEKFHALKKEITDEIKKSGVSGGYSIDSFIYSENGQMKIRTISEINYRKTMGLVTWKLAEKFAGSNAWSCLILSRARDKIPFTERLKRIESVSWKVDTKIGIILLSPGDTRFEIFFLSASSEIEGLGMLKSLQKLLPDCEFTIKI